MSLVLLNYYTFNLRNNSIAGWYIQLITFPVPNVLIPSADLYPFAQIPATYHPRVKMDPTKSFIAKKFDKVSIEEFQQVHGNKDGLADLVASKYGISKDEATKQVQEAFAEAQKQ